MCGCFGLEYAPSIKATCSFLIIVRTPPNVIGKMVVYVAVHVLRSSHWLARSALLWFALTLGAAVAMPAAHSQTEVVICTGIGMQKVRINADGTVTTSADAGISCAQ
jgi:hypothetical protein